MSELQVIGKSITRVDALAKVTGQAKYVIDEGLGLSGMLYGKVLWSPYPHARILNIDTSKAMRVPGVRAILTGKDAPSILTGFSIDDQYILAKDNVRFVGDAVAALAATSMDAAEEALELIKVDYEELPAVFDPEEAMKPDCPVIVHPELASYRRPMYEYLGKDLPGPNVHTHQKIRKGNVEEGFKKADLIVENRFTTQRIYHAQLEPVNSLAFIDHDGVLSVWSSEKMIFPIRAKLGMAFGLPLNKVRVMSSYIGGAFGRVANANLFSALLALHTGKPVKVVFTREETFVRDLGRLPKVVYLKDGVKRDGTLVAREIKLISNTGAYSEQGPMIIRNGSFQLSQYRIPNLKWDAYGVYTNSPTCGSFRGFGNTQALWAIEQHMNIIAEKLGMDPVELRKKNLTKEGEENAYGGITHSIGAAECLDKVSEWIKSEELPRNLPANIKVGRGLALGNKYTQIDTVSSAIVKVHPDGTIEVRHGNDEIGQGLNTVLAQIAAEEFSVPMEKVKVVWGDTATVPYDPGAFSSRSTLYTGNAVRLACQDAKRQMLDIAACKMEVEPAELATANGKVFARKSPDKAMPFSELFFTGAIGAQKGALCLSEGGEILGKATFLFKNIEEGDHETGQGKNLTASYHYTAQAAEIAVDTDTGIVKILRFCSATDVGKPINPKMCEAQMDGGAGMGIGSVLYEGVVMDKGKQLNPNFHDYRIPSTMQLPAGDKTAAMIVEAPNRNGPYGAKGMSEAAMTPTGPAIASAIYHAIGVRIMDLPITPEKILRALNKLGKQ